MKGKRTQGPRGLERLLDEAYLLILTRRPSASALAQELKVGRNSLDQILRRLSRQLKKIGLRVISAGARNEALQIVPNHGSSGDPVTISPEILRARRTPPRRPGLKPEDEVIYARDW